MFVIDDILLSPFKGFMWVLKEIQRAAEAEAENEAQALTQRLTTLYMELEAGTITPEEFDAREREVLDRLDALGGGSDPADDESDDESDDDSDDEADDDSDDDDSDDDDSGDDDDDSDADSADDGEISSQGAAPIPLSATHADDELEREMRELAGLPPLAPVGTPSRGIGSIPNAAPPGGTAFADPSSTKASANPPPGPTEA